MKRSTRFLVLLSTLLCLGTTAAASAATVQTNRLDYYPGENVVISGSGWQPGEIVSLLLRETPPLDPDLTLYAQADAEGNFVNAEFYTDIHDIGVAFTLTATGVNSLLAAQTTFTDSGANLDQWANDVPAEWVNGNLGASKSTYYEGNSIPYRLTFGGLTAGTTHTVTIEWDTTKGGKHALDYLTSYIQPNTGFPGIQPTPCAGVTGCDLFNVHTYDIPVDSNVTAGGVTPIAGVFTMYGGTITGVSTYTLSGLYSGDSSTRISITFTAEVSNPVLAWGGHIATRKDWGVHNSAVAISGAPYHTRLIDLDGSGGNQDRSLSADAVIFPGQIKIIKSADPEGSTVFTFTGSSAPLASFTLIDDGTTANNTKVFAIEDFKTYTVTETVPSDWKLDHITCSIDQDPMTGSTTSVSGATATLNLKEGAFATCTFFNIGTRLTVNKICVPETDAGKFNLLIDTVVKKSDAGCGSGTGAVLVTAGLHTVSETGGTDTTLSNYTQVIGGDCAADGTITLAAGDSKTCTITNTRDTGSLKISKVFDPLTSGFTGNFTIHYACDATHTGNVSIAAGGSQTISGIPTGTLCTVSEPTLPTAPTGWTFGTPTLSPADGKVTITTKATEYTVTVTNTISRDTGSLKISKVFDPLTSGFTGNFTVHYACDATHTGDVSVAAGGSQTISGIPTGTLCTVSEPTVPTAPTGWTFGTPTLSPADGKVTITTKATEYTVTVTNTISRDTGTLTIAKTLSNPDGATVPASFTVNYNCGTGYTGSRSVAPGSNATVTGIPTGNTCTITEPALAPITGYTWGAPTYTPPSIIISDKTGTFTLTVANSIARDKGTLTIAKSLSNPDGATVPASFTVNYNCGFTGSVSVAAGGSATVPNIPTGNTCTISEATLAPIAGYTWGTPTYSPASIVIADKTGTFTLNVANSITRDKGTLTIAKSLSNPDGATVPASFSVNYNCGNGFTGSVSVAAGASATVPNIPTGNTCTITEAALAPIAGYTWGNPTYSPALVVIADKTGTFTLNVANSITRDKGTLTIAKSLSNPDGASVPASFSVNYNCGNGFTGSVSVAAGGSATVPNIPTGNTCTISEAALAPIAGYTWGTPTYSPASIVIADKTGTFTLNVANSITRDKGTLTIAKSLSNPDGATVPASFSVNYNCGNGFTGSVSVAAGASATVPNIPTGNTCAITEAALAPIPGYTWGTPTYSPASIVIADKTGTFALNVANSITRDKGTLTIAKSLSNPDGASVPASFSVNYNCGAGYEGIVSVAPGGSATVSGIPTGNTCTIAEAGLAPIPGYTWGNPTYSPASVIISDKTGTFTLTVANSITRDKGTLTIAKTLSNPEGAVVPSFEIFYSCGNGLEGSVSVAAGASATVPNIPTGSTCTLSELALAPIAGYTWGTPTYTPALIVISDKVGTFTITVGNSITRDKGTLTIAKTLSNPDGAVVPAFEILYSCGNGFTGSVSVAAGGSATVPNIPTGSTCTVSEPVLTPISGYTWGTPTFTPASIVISDKIGTFTITVANSITRDLGTLTIAKSLSNPDGASVPASFTVDYNCGAGHTGSRSVPPGGNATVTGIPTGNTCTITEAALSPITGYTWGTPTYSPASIVISDKTGTFTLTVGNSITRDRGTLTIAKSLSNPDGANVPASFTVNYDCGTGYTGNRSVAPGGIATIAGIPTGNTCTISEAALSPIVGYTWGAPTYSPASIVISNETGTFTLTAANSITRDRGALQITKTVLPSTFSGSFSVHVACTGDGGAYDATISYPSPGLVTISNIPTGNTCTVTETSKAAPLAGYTWLPETITGGPATIVKGGTATVTVANKLTGLAKVVKTVTGALPTGTQAFTFQIRQGASTIANGTTIASGVANASNNGEITFSADLTPGATYQICEIVMPAWTTTLGDFVPDSFNPPDGTVPNPNVDNSILCGSFTVNAGETKVFAVDNTPPPGGRALTIGFWKNWSSCSGSNGGQEPVLDQMLGAADPAGITVGMLTLHATDCEYAVRLLNKSTVDTRKKMASDPLFNLAAQLLAAELNLTATAYRCPRVATAIDNANNLLKKYGFAGKAYSQKLKGPDATLANNLARYLDDYNNNRTGVCP